MEEKVILDIPDEDLDKVEFSEGEFGVKWCIWECYKLEEKKHDDFKQDLLSLFTISNIQQFIDIFTLAHQGQPSKLFA